MKKGSVSAGYLKSILDYAVEKGASRAALLSALQLDDSIFADADNRVPMEKFQRMMQLGATHTNNPAFLSTIAGTCHLSARQLSADR